MSLPPPNPNTPGNPNTPFGPGPGGFYGGPPRPSGVSGWKIAGFGCLGLLLLGIVGIVLLGVSFKNNMAHPSRNSVVGIGVLLSNAHDDGKTITEAVRAFHAQHGHYPPSLAALVADRGLDPALLHNPLDGNPDPKHVSWTYAQPPEGAPGTAPVLTEPYDIMPGRHDNDGLMTVTLNGDDYKK